ncbi:thioredoxin [Patescibacteria group bacterium]|nr:thioredoxin [Patescibacteria group bacterium]MBU1931365.1 thioredoxin [Patescibacteria group bacterium]
MTVKHFTQDNFEAEVLKAAKPVLVDFFAEWCGPCKLAGPVMDELAEEYKDKVIVGKVNVDEASALAGQYNVMSIPVVIIFKNGQEVDRITGFPGKQGYEEKIKALI